MVSVVTECGGGRYKLRLRGHAGYNPGNDIVCAATSAIVFALMGYLANAKEHISDTVTLDYAPGEVSIDVLGDDTLSPAFTMAYIGLAQIAESYPENIKIENICIP